MRRFSEAELELIWDRRSEGVGMRTVAELGRAPASVRTMVESHGGVRPRPPIRSPRHLRLVTREAARNGGRSGYRAHRADRSALRRARRPRLATTTLGENRSRTAQDWCAGLPVSYPMLDGWIQPPSRANSGDSEVEARSSTAHSLACRKTGSMPVSCLKLSRSVSTSTPSVRMRCVVRFEPSGRVSTHLT